MNIIQNDFPSKFNTIESIKGKYLDQTADINSESSKISVTSATYGSFGDIFARKANEIDSVKFSKHASNRLSERNISLSESQLQRLNEGTKKASGKGINESLIMVDQLAFIVNIPNATVITAMDQTETNENVFTNIDGAVII